MLLEITDEFSWLNYCTCQSNPLLFLWVLLFFSEHLFCVGGWRNNLTFSPLSSLFVFLIYSELNSCDLYVFYQLPPNIKATCFLLAPCSNDVTMYICLSTVSGSCTFMNDCTCLDAILFKLPLRSFAFFAWWHWPTAPGDPPCQSSFYLCRYINYLTGFFSFILKGSHHKEVWKMESSAVREKQVLRARGQPILCWSAQ